MTGEISNTGTIKSASYFFLSQEAQNEYDKYEKAELIMMLERVYKDDAKKLERIYRDALREEIIKLITYRKWIMGFWKLSELRADTEG